MKQFSSDTSGKVVSVVVVTCQYHVLMGKRRDSGRWAIPGGHMEDGEMPETAARREMVEECGIKPSYLQYIKSFRLNNDEGRLTVHIYHTELSDMVEGDGSDDPDNEVKKWEWIDISKGLPDDIREKLHRDLDLGLIAMGIL
jgi:ADP-ribose pyrophosphatase YjhB (NUDIX family)